MSRLSYKYIHSLSIILSILLACVGWLFSGSPERLAPVCPAFDQHLPFIFHYFSRKRSISVLHDRHIQPSLLTLSGIGMEGADALLVEKCFNNKFKKSGHTPGHAALEGGMTSLSELFKRRGGVLFVVLAVHIPHHSSPLPFVVCVIVGNKKAKKKSCRAPCCHIALLAVSSLSSSLLIPFVPLIFVGRHGGYRRRAKGVDFDRC